MKKQYLTALSIVLIILAASPATAEVLYDLIDLGAGNAYSINNLGQVVGTFNGRAILFDSTGEGNNIDLGKGCAYSINDNSQAVGGYGICSAPGEEPTWPPITALLYDLGGNGNYIELGSGIARSINNEEQITGSDCWNCILYDANGSGANVNLGDGLPYSINNNDQIVGFSGDMAMLFDSTGTSANTELGTLGRTWSKAYSINDNGQAVGESMTNFQSCGYGFGGMWYCIYYSHAALYDTTGEGNNVDLGTLCDHGNCYSAAYSINNNGQIVGACGDPKPWVPGLEGSAVLFDETGEWNNINLDMLIDPNLGWSLKTARCINDNGWIVGWGINPQGHLHSYLLIPKPPVIEADIDIEPDSLNLHSKGKWFTCYIRLPEGSDVNEIEPNSILLEDQIEAQQFWANEQEQFAVVKFSRSEIQQLLAGLESLDLVELTISGELTDGTIFEGTDVIRVIDKGDKK